MLQSHKPLCIVKEPGPCVSRCVGHQVNALEAPSHGSANLTTKAETEDTVHLHRSHDAVSAVVICTSTPRAFISPSETGGHGPGRSVRAGGDRRISTATLRLPGASVSQLAAVYPGLSIGPGSRRPGPTSNLRQRHLHHVERARFPGGGP